MAPTTTIYIVRHAQSRPTKKLDDADWPLSETGIRQAEQLAGLLEPLGIDGIVSSSYLRCLETIRPFARTSGLAIAVDEELRERRITIGLREDFPEVLQRSWNDFSYALPGCESSAEALERLRQAMERIAWEHAGRTVAVCSHGNAISLFLHSLDSRFGLREMSRRNPDVLRLTADGDGIRHDSGFTLPGLHELATDHTETPIDW